jgi:hypothetical protein
MLHMGMDKSKDKDQPTCVDLAKSKIRHGSQVGGGKVLGAAMRPMCKGLRKKATSHSNHCLYSLVCIFAWTTNFLLLFTSIHASTSNAHTSPLWTLIHT